MGRLDDLGAGLSYVGHIGLQMIKTIVIAAQSEQGGKSAFVTGNRGCKKKESQLISPERVF